MTEIYRDATFSHGGKYRYTLTRSWPQPHSRGMLLWVMLNPSTADAEKDDATIRRVINFSRGWEFEAAVVVNLYAWRATDPKNLWAAAKQGENIIGPKNDKWITKEVYHATRVICAWGANADFHRPPEVLRLLEKHKKHLWTLGLTVSGHPLHPLRIPADRQPEKWKVNAPDLAVAITKKPTPTTILRDKEGAG